MQDIAGYHIVAEIGRGGMGIVYHAVETATGRDVALKVMPPNLTTDEQYASRFTKEAKTLTLLDHPNIVRIIDHGMADNYRYIAMQYIDGKSLKSLIDNGPIPPARAFDILKQIAGALDYAHGMKVLHRDVKPENILIDDRGMAHLVDFGIARGVDAQTRMTAAGMTIGTVHYMSPEQCRGEQLRPESDYYSLGVVAYEMLSGKVPYDSKDPFAVALMHINQAPPPLSGELSVFAPFFRRIMSKNPAQRYGSASEIERDLTLLLAGGTIDTQKTMVLQAEKTAVLRTVKEKPAKRTLIIGGGLALIVVVALVAVLLYWPRSPVEVGGGGGGSVGPAPSAVGGKSAEAGSGAAGFFPPRPTAGQEAKGPAPVTPQSPKDGRTRVQAATSDKRQGSKARPDELSGMIAKAESLLQQKEFQRAKDAAEEVLKVSPDNVQAYRIKDAAQGEMAKARDEDRQSQGRQEALVYFREGKAHYERGEYKLCISKMQEVLKRMPDSEDAKRYISLSDKAISDIYKGIGESAKSQEVTIKKK